MPAAFLHPATRTNGLRERERGERGRERERERERQRDREEDMPQSHAITVRPAWERSGRAVDIRSASPGIVVSFLSEKPSLRHVILDNSPFSR